MLWIRTDPLEMKGHMRDYINFTFLSECRNQWTDQWLPVDCWDQRIEHRTGFLWWAFSWWDSFRELYFRTCRAGSGKIHKWSLSDPEYSKKYDLENNDLKKKQILQPMLFCVPMGSLKNASQFGSVVWPGPNIWAIGLYYIDIQIRPQRK